MAQTNPLIASPAIIPDLKLRSVKGPQFAMRGDSWSITLSRNTTVIEMAAVMLRFRCHAEVLLSGDVRLWPFDSCAGWPTAKEVAELMEHGVKAELHPNPSKESEQC